MKRDKARGAAGSEIITIDILTSNSIARYRGLEYFLLVPLILGFRWRSTPGSMLSAASQTGFDFASIDFLCKALAHAPETKDLSKGLCQQV